MVAPLRIGVLGAARITGKALLQPARQVDGVEVAAIAARDPERARQYAAKHGIPRTLPDYDRLLADDAIDAVYLPLPAALHGRWTTAALEAGKHVLVEKPFTANADEAERVAAVAAGTPFVLMEAYHSAHHPLLAHLRTLLDSGMIGAVRSATAVFCAPIPPGKDIRWNPALAGGGLLDVGYYPVRLLRDLFGAEPAVQGARAWERNGIDRLLIADLRFPAGVTGQVVSSIWSRRLLSSRLEVQGSRGRMRVSWPYHPQFGSRLRIDGRGVRLRERPSRRPTYAYQLEAFRDAVAGRAAVVTGAPEAVQQMRVLDDIYRAAGMRPRKPARDA